MFNVQWTIDLYADSAEDAARQALAIQRDPTSISTVFDVLGAEGPERQSIDLTEIDEADDDMNHHCAACGRPEDDCSADPCFDVIADRVAFDRVAFDPSKVNIDRHRSSTTQGEVSVSYDGELLGRFGDVIRLIDGNWRGQCDEYWMASVQRMIEARA
jgi:hypothetical protein